MHYVVALLTLPLMMASGLSIVAALASAAVASVAFFLHRGRVRLVAPHVVLVPLAAMALRGHGIDGLVAACVLAGLMQVLLGVFRCGRAFVGAPAAVVHGLVAVAVCLAFAVGATTHAPITLPIRPTHLLAVNVLAILPLAAAIAVVSTLASLASPRASDPNRTLLALGLANTASGLCAGLPVAVTTETTPLTRTRFDAVVVLAIVLMAIVFGYDRAAMFAAALALIVHARAQQRLTITVIDGPTVLARVEGRLFFASRAELASLHKLDGREAVVLDVSRLSHVDASGVRELSLLVRSLRARGCALTVVADETLRPHLD